MNGVCHSGLIAAALALSVACTNIEATSTAPVYERRIEQVEQYLDRLAPILSGNVLSVEQRAELAAVIRSGQSVPQVVRVHLDAWSTKPFLQKVARDFVERTLSLSGARDGIDFGQPGNLAELIVRDALPWREILTHDACVGADLEPADCGTGAPFASGVVGTRAYMVSRAGRFNLTRAGNMMGAFTCKHYPMPDTFEPRLAKEMLIPMFASDSPDVEKDKQGPDEFGNGFACYSCHGQFGAHAQLFVRFDQNGIWHEDATGLQDSEGELGRSTDGLYASHFINPEEASLPRSQILGQPVENLPAAAKVVAASPEFLQCAADGFLTYALGLAVDTHLPGDLLREIASNIAASQSAGDAKFADILIESLGHPRVIAGATADLFKSQDPSPGASPRGVEPDEQE